MMGTDKLVMTVHIDAPVNLTCGDGICQNGGICNKSALVCVCQDGFTGEFCGSEPEPALRHAYDVMSLLPIACGVLFLYVVCFVLVYMNTWLSERQARARQEEIDNAIHVDGPPHLNRPRSATRLWRGIPFTPSTFLYPFIGTRSRRPSRSREGTMGMHGVSTAPAVLQGGTPPKYAYVATSEDESNGSFATVQGSRPNLVPPTYEEAVRLQETMTGRNDASVSSAGGLSMRTIPSAASNVLDDHDTSSSNLISLSSASAIENTSQPEPTLEIQEDSDDDDSLILDGSARRPSAGILVTFRSPLVETITPSNEDSERQHRHFTVSMVDS